MCSQLLCCTGLAQVIQHTSQSFRCMCFFLPVAFPAAFAPGLARAKACTCFGQTEMQPTPSSLRACGDRRRQFACLGRLRLWRFVPIWPAYPRLGATGCMYRWHLASACSPRARAVQTPLMLYPERRSWLSLTPDDLYYYYYWLNC